MTLFSPIYAEVHALKKFAPSIHVDLPIYFSFTIIVEFFFVKLTIVGIDLKSFFSSIRIIFSKISKAAVSCMTS